MPALPSVTYFWRQAGAADTAWTEAPSGVFSPPEGVQVEVVSVGASRVRRFTALAAPAALGLSDQVLSAGGSGVIDAAAGFTGGELSFALSGAPAWAGIDPATGAISWTAPESDVPVADWTVTASNSRGSASNTFSVSVATVAGLYGLWDFADATASGGTFVALANAQGEGPDFVPLRGTTALSGGEAALTGSQAVGALRAIQASFVQHRNLPDATNPGGAPGEATPEGITGFTVTGLDRIDAGDHAGAWVMGNHGLAREGTEGSYSQAAGIVIVSADLSTVLLDVTVPPSGSVNSVQGVAYSAHDDCIWVASPVNRRLYRVDQAGAILQSVDTTAQGQINGLCYVDDTNQLIGTTVGGDGFVWNAATGAYVGTLATSTYWPQPDQLSFDGETKMLYATFGGNGSPGTVRYLTLDVSGSVSVDAGGLRGDWGGSLPDSLAIEGLFYDRGARKLWIANDTPFHLSAERANVLSEYDAHPPVLPFGDVLVIGGVTDMTAGSNAYRVLASSDGAAGFADWTLYYGYTSRLHFALGSAGGSNKVFASFPTASDVDGPHSWMIVADTTAGTLTAYLDGVDVGPPTFRAAAGEVPFASWNGAFRLSSIILGAEYNNGAWSRHPVGDFGRLAIGADPAAVQAALDA